MSDDPESEPSVALSAAASAEWNRLVDGVLRGVAHAMNNRAAALAALLELTTEPIEAATVLREIIGAEQQRVRELVRVLRVIGAPEGSREAFSPADVLDDVRLVFGVHPELRDGAVSVDADGAAPVRTYRWAFARAVITLAAGFARAAATDDVRIVITTEGDWLVIASRTNAAPMTLLTTELATIMDGEALGDARGIRIPTLAALRRREGR